MAPPSHAASGAGHAHAAAPRPQREHDLRPFTHAHAFGDPGMAGRQRALLAVTLLTLVTMLIELAAGWWTGSLALLADGWHMGTHVLALGGALLAYRLSARARQLPGYAFGGWKIEVLAAYTSGLALMVVAAGLVVDAVQRLLAPVPIAYAEAMVVAVLGLAVNLASIWLMERGTRGAPHDDDAQGHDRRGDDAHDHPEHRHDGPGHDHAHAPRAAHAHGHDHNFSAAYWHVIADALTSVLAIAALAGGLWFGWRWLDAAVALLGAALIARWAWRMLAHTARALVDATQEPALAAQVRAAIEADGDARVADLHVWQVGANAWSAAIGIVADHPLAAAAYRGRLAGIDQLHHLTVEVNRCPRGGCTAASPTAFSDAPP